MFSGTSNMQRPISKIYIDASHTAHSGLNAGIQRVVRNIVRSAPLIAKQYDAQVEVITIDATSMQRVDAARVLTPQIKNSTPASDNSLHAGYRQLPNPISALLPSKRARRFVKAASDQVGLTWLLLRPFRLMKHQDSRLGAQNSALVLLDATWDFPENWPQIEEFKSRGGLVVGVVYDVIPLSHPQFFTEGLPPDFKRWLFKLLEVADGIVCISAFSADCVRGVVEERLSEGLLLSRPTITHFHLGSGLDLVSTGDSLASDMQQVFQGDGNIFLVVGSIEPRKNHAYVLDAFDRFWATGGRASLVVIGRSSWKSEEFLARVAAHPKANGRLRVLRNASDADLDFAYNNASGLIFASKIEGFGLPIVEAFRHGLPVLCSDIPVFREIADGKATFFDLSDPANLANALAEFCTIHDAAKRTMRSPQPYLTWEQSTEQLFQGISFVHKQVGSSDPVR